MSATAGVGFHAQDKAATKKHVVYTSILLPALVFQPPFITRTRPGYSTPSPNTWNQNSPPSDPCCFLSPLRFDLEHSSLLIHDLTFAFPSHISNVSTVSGSSDAGAASGCHSRKPSAFMAGGKSGGGVGSRYYSSFSGEGDGGQGSSRSGGSGFSEGPGLGSSSSGGSDFSDAPPRLERVSPTRIYYPGQTYETDDLAPKERFEKEDFTKSQKSFRQPMQGKKLDKQILATLDFRDARFLSQFVNETGKVLPKRKTGLSAKVHRRMVQQIKVSRVMGIMPFTERLPGLVKAKKH